MENPRAQRCHCIYVVLHPQFLGQSSFIGFALHTMPVPYFFVSLTDKPCEITRRSEQSQIVSEERKDVIPKLQTKEESRISSGSDKEEGSEVLVTKKGFWFSKHPLFRAPHWDRSSCTRWDFSCLFPPFLLALVSWCVQDMNSRTVDQCLRCCKCNMWYTILIHLWSVII